MSFLPSVIWWQIGTDCWPRLGIKKPRKPRKLDHSLNRRYDGVWLTILMFELTIWERRLMIDYVKFRIYHMCNSRRHMHGHTRLITMPQPRSASTSPLGSPKSLLHASSTEEAPLHTANLFTLSLSQVFPLVLRSSTRQYLFPLRPSHPTSPMAPMYSPISSALPSYQAISALSSSSRYLAQDLSQRHPVVCLED